MQPATSSTVSGSGNKGGIWRPKNTENKKKQFVRFDINYAHEDLVSLFLCSNRSVWMKRTETNDSRWKADKLTNAGDAGQTLAQWHHIEFLLLTFSLTSFLLRYDFLWSRPLVRAPHKCSNKNWIKKHRNWSDYSEIYQLHGVLRCHASEWTTRTESFFPSVFFID